MRRQISLRTAWAVALSLGVALLLLCAGGLALQQSGGTTQEAGQGGVASADHAAPFGAPLLASGETLDSDDTAPAGFEYLNVLAVGSFLVSLGLLLGAGLVGGCAERRLLELLRLPRVISLTPARPPLFVLEVFRL